MFKLWSSSSAPVIMFKFYFLVLWHYKEDHLSSISVKSDKGLPVVWFCTHNQINADWLSCNQCVFFSFSFIVAALVAIWGNYRCTWISPESLLKVKEVTSKVIQDCFLLFGHVDITCNGTSVLHHLWFLDNSDWKSASLVGVQGFLGCETVLWQS